MRNDTTTIIQQLVAKGVPMQDITRAMQARRTREIASQHDLAEARKQRVGVLL